MSRSYRRTHGAVSIFEDRLKKIRGKFRFPSGTKCHDFTRPLVDLAKLTCKQRQHAIMLYPYGLGSQGKVLRPEFRQVALRVVNLAHVVLIAMSNLRPLTTTEAHQSFTVAGRELFLALSKLRYLTLKFKRRLRDPTWRAAPDHLESCDSMESDDTEDTQDHEKHEMVSICHVFLLSCSSASLHSHFSSCIGCRIISDGQKDYTRSLHITG